MVRKNLGHLIIKLWCCLTIDPLLDPVCNLRWNKKLRWIFNVSSFLSLDPHSIARLVWAYSLTESVWLSINQFPTWLLYSFPILPSPVGLKETFQAASPRKLTSVCLKGPRWLRGATFGRLAQFYRHLPLTNLVSLDEISESIFARLLIVSLRRQNLL